MKNADVINHVKGTSLFIDDFPAPEGVLHIAVFDSKIACGKITKLNYDKVLSVPGVAAVITAKDIPGENQIGNIVSDETILADGEVEYIGEPIAIVAADTVENAKAAANLIEIEFDELPAVTDPREAYEKGNLIAPPQTFSDGDVEKGFAESDVVIDGRVDIGGQEHLYLETQGAMAVPSEDGKIKIYSSTQSPTAVQRAAAKVLGVPMHKIETDVLRLGGGFGGKEDQATPWAVMTALVSRLTGKPAKLILSRQDDLRMTGKRHPYSADYKIGLSRDGEILAYEATYYQNAGACADLSTAILERTLFHATNSYFIPNVKTTGISCKTNLPPNTAFRGFGGPQGMFVMETAIYKAAEKLGVPAYEIQKKNLLKENDSLYYGQKAERVQAERCWNEAAEEFNLQEKFAAVKEFNEKNNLRKKGVALMPICFGISFTSSFLNQASALVHVYTDGSVGVSTAAVEMGQGVNEKIRSVVSQTFSISQEKVKMETTNTTRVANTSPTAASSGADLNGNAALLACNNILNRLKKFAAESLKEDDPAKVEIKNEKIFYDGKETGMNWESFINDAYFNRINLASHAFYATPEVYFDRTINKGRPFAYHVYGTAIITAEVDILRGVCEIESVDVVHDFGKSINRQVDLGQVEGAVVQGIGWLTMEELVQNDEGKLLSNSLSTYKIPDIFSAPKEMNVKFLEDSENPFGPLNSKAIGEPPFMYGIGAYFAIMNAMKEYNPNADKEIRAPLTHERVLMSLKNLK
ncbi:MAG: molybdopterin-dependent oxidoreductase [Chlorobi bacterium]|nr:molybdopterin-dependent oxidoreductase [Chlorobiota bacterium]